MRDTDLRARLQSWALPLALLLVLLVPWIAISVRAPNWLGVLYVAVCILPGLAMWLWGGATYFAVATWLVPASIIIGAAWLVDPDIRFYGWFVIAAGFVIWSITCTTAGWQIWLRFERPLGEWLVALGLKNPDRIAYREVTEIRANAQVSGRVDPDALRADGERYLRIRAPDERWSSVLRFCADPLLAWADMLEDKRAFSQDELRSSFRKRDLELAALMRDRSVPYRLMTLKLREASDGPQGESASVR